MPFASIPLLRELTNFSETLVSDQTLETLKPFADRLIVRSAFARKYLERLNGRVNGSNQIYTTNFRPIADLTAMQIVTIDNAEAITGWAGAGDGGTPTSNTTEFIIGAKSLNLIKTGSAVQATWVKTQTAFSVREISKVRVRLFILDATEKAKFGTEKEDIQIQLGDGTSTASWFIGGKVDVGWNTIEIDPLHPDAQTGSLDIDAITVTTVLVNTGASDAFTDGKFIMDEWDYIRPLVDDQDIQVILAILDSENNIQLGSAVPVSSVDALSGRITVTTAPTNDGNASTGAEAGVFAIYYYAPHNIDYSLLELASTYLLAHLASFKIAGKAADMSQTQAIFLRRDIAGAPDEWLRMAISTLQDAIGQTATGVGFRNVNRPKRVPGGYNGGHVHGLHRPRRRLHRGVIGHPMEGYYY